ncbi:hypothetical protein ACE2AJ_06870 [Aquihabitans daechungensis]|uniref:hypothetical protein n=1 Tax=Aquihabitans daechungensis TaxID=1052257 RepID=UPI003BA0AED8
MTRAGGDWDHWLAHRLGSIRDQGRWRAHREFDAWGPRGTLRTVGADGAPVEQKVLSFASNDYLGLSIHPAVVAAAHDAIDRWGTARGRPAWSPATARSTKTSSANWRRGSTPSAPCCFPPGSPPTSGS